MGEWMDGRMDGWIQYRGDPRPGSQQYSLYDLPPPPLVVTGVLAIGAIVKERVHGRLLGPRHHRGLIQGGLQQVDGVGHPLAEGALELHAQVWSPIAWAGGATTIGRRG